ncbi:MAG: pyridoxal-phosphate dependent enzyme, partial [Sphingomonadales bacterium]
MALKLPGLEDVHAARRRIAGLAIRSPLVPYHGVPEDGSAGANRIFLKLESLQPGGSFKIRAGGNALRSLASDELGEGVYTASAGNFALGIALAAAELGCSLKVFAPEGAARKKIEALKGLGATVELLPFEGWWKIMIDHGRAGEPGVFMHPVADPRVIAGNATIGLEIIEDLPETDCILVPFGGGGLISGIGSAAKALKLGVRMIGCESEAATPLAAALQAGGPVKVPFDTGTFINGIGSTSVLDEMWPLVSVIVDGAASVSVEEAGRAVVKLMS